MESKALDAEVRGSRWLADGNAAKEKGNMAKAEKCYVKSQFWLDRYNKLTGRGEAEDSKRSRLSDSDRLEWLLRNVSGTEFRRLGIIYSDGARRSDIDQAMFQHGA